MGAIPGTRTSADEVGGSARYREQAGTGMFFGLVGSPFGACIGWDAPTDALGVDGAASFRAIDREMISAQDSVPPNGVVNALWAAVGSGAAAVRFITREHAVPTEQSFADEGQKDGQ